MNIETMDSEQTENFDTICIGDKAFISKMITEEDVCVFAEISSDYNPVHLDHEYACSTRFQKRIVHGMLVASLISAVIGTKLPGQGTVYLSQTLNFRAPVLLGETVYAEVEVIDKIIAKNQIKLKTVCFNQDDKVVLDGEALVLVEKTL